MNHDYPIYTQSTDCRDCYKCVRRCPVKSIRVEDARAAVMPERCICCGDCVHVCPAGAKQVRDDTRRARSLLARKAKVVASLAPSFISQWPELTPSRLAGAIKQLGFHAVSETALGAESVSRTLAASLKNSPPALHISTACPVVVDYIRKYAPAATSHLTPLLSPMQAHAAMLKQHFGAETAVVFIGPCIAKKAECEEPAGETDLALTFQELQEWFEMEQIAPASATPASFVPHAASHGALYPVAGGMGRTLQDYDVGKVDIIALSGMQTIMRSLRDLAEAPAPQTPVVLEALACPGGCIGGPQMAPAPPQLEAEIAIRRNARPGPPATAPAPAVCHTFAERPPATERHGEQSIREALATIGKYRAGDELNCGGCGYDTCRSFAHALLCHKAEPPMCLSHLRRLAQNKAHALLRSMPAGVVIVDHQLRVVECNEAFARSAGPDAMMGYDAQPGLEGAKLHKLLPFADHFRQVLATGTPFRAEALRDGERLLNVTIFPIEPSRVVGGIILNVTRTVMRRELIAQKARAVIDKNMVTVQEIACRLGEHMADTELLLRSIAEDYAEGERGHA